MSNMSKQNNSQDFLNKVVMYLDGALSKEQERELLIEIRRSPERLEKFRIEKSFREFLRSKVSRRAVSPNLVRSIKDKIYTSPI